MVINIYDSECGDSLPSPKRRKKEPAMSFLFGESTTEEFDGIDIEVDSYFKEHSLSPDENALEWSSNNEGCYPTVHKDVLNSPSHICTIRKNFLYCWTYRKSTQKLFKSIQCRHVNFFE